MAHKTDPQLVGKRDILDKNDIVVLVDAFYMQVRQDPLLGPVFKQRIPDGASWQPHLQTMYNFWNSILFAEPEYNGRPFPKHIGLGISPEHFDRWIGYFHQTVDLYFTGPKAEEAKSRAGKIRMIFEGKLKFIEG